MRKILFSLLILFALSIAVIFGIKYLNETMFVDFNHGFILTDMKDWKTIPPKEGAYKSLVIVENNTIISYADIRFIKKQKILDEATHVRVAKESCQIWAGEENIVSKNIEITEFKKDKSVAVKCTAEAIGAVSKLPVIITMYSFFGLKDNVLVITTSYLKGNDLGELKVQKLIQGLRIL